MALKEGGGGRGGTLWNFLLIIIASSAVATDISSSNNHQQVDKPGTNKTVANHEQIFAMFVIYVISDIIKMSGRSSFLLIKSTRRCRRSRRMSIVVDVVIFLKGFPLLNRD